MKKIIVMLLTVALICSCGEKQQKTKAPIRVKVETLTSSTNFAQSYVGVVEEKEATAVSFTTMGVVKRIYVNEGQTVGRGQLLAEIDPTTASNSVEMAHATLNQSRDMVRQAEAAYNQAKDAYERMKKLHDNGVLPDIKWVEVQTQLAQARTALSTARSGVHSAAAAEKIARKGLADTHLYAPVGGVIGKKKREAGETALPSQAVVNILDISSVKVKVAIPEREMRYVRANTSSVINVEAIGRQFAGGYIEKGVQADALTHTYDVYIHVDNPNRELLPGMVANVRLGIVPLASDKDRHESLTLPVTSVQRRANGSLFVWTIDKENKAHRRNVTTGGTVGNRIAVTSGLNGNERIVTEGYHKLSENSKVCF